MQNVYGEAQLCVMSHDRCRTVHERDGSRATRASGFVLPGILSIGLAVETVMIHT